MSRKFWIAVVAGLLVSATAQAQVKLEWKFKEGEKFFQEVVSKTKQAQKVKVMGMEQNLNTDATQTSILSMTVLKKTADGVVIDQKFESTKTEGAGLGAAAGNAMQQMEGIVFRITLNGKNQVTKLDGMQEFIKKIAGDDPQIRKMAEKMMSEETMKKQIEDSFAFLPENTIKAGDKWEHKSSVPLGPMGGFDVVHNFTYAGKEKVAGKELDKITVNATMTYIIPKPDPLAPLNIVKGDLKGNDFSGVYYFDAAAGKLVQSEIKMKIKGNLTLSAMGQTIDMTMDQDTASKIRILDKNPLK